MAPLTAAEAYVLPELEFRALQSRAKDMRDSGFGSLISYSPKVFIPLTHLCRDACGYCTFAKAPSKAGPAFMEISDILAVAKAGATAGCHEVLFTLGDKPELRYRSAAKWLEDRGFATTLDYLRVAADAVINETGMLPHINAGVMTRDELAKLRTVSLSQGLMLETNAARLSERGGPHFGCPDKEPQRRLDMIRAAGEAQVPFTTGILVGIGETRRERVDSLLAIRELHSEYGHIQEVIVQNFKPKAGTRMERAAEPSQEELLWTISTARLILGADTSIQVPPNLNAGMLEPLIEAGINDWGGVSPITPDHVNPEAAWPHLEILRASTATAGKTLVPRLTIYPPYVRAADRWVDSKLQPALNDLSDAMGFAREVQWCPGTPVDMPTLDRLYAFNPAYIDCSLDRILDKALGGSLISREDIVALFGARGRQVEAVIAAANAMRHAVNGDDVTFVVTRNINYTNICTYRCTFCAFSKGRATDHLRGKPYILDLPEVVRRAAEAWERGATEVCLQGGIHPSYTGQTYLDICSAIHQEIPGLHIHAFSPLEILHGATSLGITPSDFLAHLKDNGLASLPGTAAEILDDDVRRVICPDKLNTSQWLSVIEAAHGVGLRTTATIMFGHVDAPQHWAGHLLHLRELQMRTGGFTEFVPLPFVPMEAPMYLRGKARRGPSLREAVLMHAVSRLALNPYFTNIQTSWPKMGSAGAVACLNAGCNDLGGTLMNESISKAAGADHGQEFTPSDMENLIIGLNRTPAQRTTLYGKASQERRSTARTAAPLVGA